MSDVDETEDNGTEEGSVELDEVEEESSPVQYRQLTLAELAETGVTAWVNLLAITVRSASRLHMNPNQRQPLGDKKRVPPMVRQYAKFHNLAHAARQAGDDELAARYEVEAGKIMKAIDVGMRADVKLFMDHDIKVREQKVKEKMLGRAKQVKTGAEDLSEDDLQAAVDKYGSD